MSHSSQGQTADRVLIPIDTELGAKDLLNNRMAYVAVSRGAYDAQMDRSRCLCTASRTISAKTFRPSRVVHPPFVLLSQGRW
jgi:ATP-dependent exoDNAse (exonuclease V) alpha subunit